jgi:hypothetical protein
MPQQKYLPNCPQKNKKNFWQLIMIRKKELGIHCVVLPFTVAILAVRVIVYLFYRKISIWLDYDSLYSIENLWSYFYEPHIQVLNAKIWSERDPSDQFAVVGQDAMTS